MNKVIRFWKFCCLEATKVEEKQNKVLDDAIFIHVVNFYEKLLAEVELKYRTKDHLIEYITKEGIELIL